MKACVKEMTSVTEELCDAMALLMPQLSSAPCVPSFEGLRQIVEGDAAVLFAAYADERIVGVLTLVWYDAPSGRKAWIEDVVVDAAARGCGVGVELITAAVAHAAKIGAGRVQLTSSPARTAAHALYRKMGFMEAKTSVFVFKTDKE